MSRTQQGNNNAWCQDNELSWFDWQVDEPGGKLLDFTRALIAFRVRHPTFRRRSFFTGGAQGDSGLPDLWWFRPDGRKMTQRDWGRGEAKAIGCFLNGEDIPTHSPSADEARDDSFLVLFNGHHEPITFNLPTRRFGLRWELVLSTAYADGFVEGGVVVPAREPIEVEGRSVAVLRRSA
jgi:glycogen operon protein